MALIHYWQSSASIRDEIFIPKYYNPEIAESLIRLATTHDCHSIAQLVEDGILVVETGHEIGKAAYGTGDIPFVRTSDIANWEIKSAPKQGVSKEIYEEYAASQDVQVGDILFVRDGTYLIGRNCFITAIDKEILYQSHILKLRVKDPDRLDPTLLFLSLNSPFVQRQIRSVQFTADIIDTIGQRFFELVLPIPKSPTIREKMASEARKALQDRMRGKAFVKHCPTMLEEALRTGKSDPIESFIALDDEAMVNAVSNETVSAELGSFTAFWRNSDTIANSIFLPKYYDTSIPEELDDLSENCELLSVGDLAKAGAIEFHTGDEIGKMAYGTGEIPFLRTSDFANWEINHNPKQGVSEEIYQQYASGEDVRENDILLVRDGTYLVGSSCIITKEDAKSLFCGGLFKFRVLPGNALDPFLFLGLLNSYIVKRQIRTKQFTRDVIDTIGNRIEEVILPIPKSDVLRKSISNAISDLISSRVEAREKISALTKSVVP
jgi:restriction endonuclease S subunit